MKIPIPLIFCLLGTNVALGMFSQPSAIPLARVIKNTEAKLETHLILEGWKPRRISSETAVGYALQAST